jgi:hypothetical protein
MSLHKFLPKIGGKGHVKANSQGSRISLFRPYDENSILQSPTQEQIQQHLESGNKLYIIPDDVVDDTPRRRNWRRIFTFGLSLNNAAKLAAVSGMAGALLNILFSLNFIISECRSRYSLTLPRLTYHSLTRSEILSSDLIGIRTMHTRRICSHTGNSELLYCLGRTTSKSSSSLLLPSDI